MRQLKVSTKISEEKEEGNNNFPIEFQEKLSALKKKQLDYSAKLNLLREVRNGDNNKIEELAESFDFDIYLNIKALPKNKLPTEELFHEMKSFVKDFIVRDSKSNNTEKFFFKSVVYSIQQKVREF